MAEINAWIYPHTNNPVVVHFPGKDFTGHDVEFRLYPFGQEGSVLSTVDGTLFLVAPNDEGKIDGIGIPTTEGLLAQTPPGKSTAVDAIDIVGEVRQKFAAGTLAKGGPGEFCGLQLNMVDVPGIQGAAPWVHRGSWAAGSFAARSSVTHHGSTWLTLLATDAEPDTEDAPWEVLLDGTGAAADRQAAEEAAQAAAGSAFAADIAARVEFSINIYNASGVPAGTWYLDREARQASELNNLVAEIIAGTGSLSFYIAADGINHGPFVTTAGARLVLDDEPIAVSAGGDISVVVPIGFPAVTEAFFKLWGSPS